MDREEIAKDRGPSLRKEKDGHTFNETESFKALFCEQRSTFGSAMRSGCSIESNSTASGHKSNYDSAHSFGTAASSQACANEAESNPGWF